MYVGMTCRMFVLAQRDADAANAAASQLHRFGPIHSFPQCLGTTRSSFAPGLREEICFQWSKGSVILQVLLSSEGEQLWTIPESSNYSQMTGDVVVHC